MGHLRSRTAEDRGRGEEGMEVGRKEGGVGRGWGRGLEGNGVGMEEGRIKVTGGGFVYFRSQRPSARVWYPEGVCVCACAVGLR